MNWISQKQNAIAILATVAIAMHLLLRFALGASELASNVPLWIALTLGGVPLVWDLLKKLLRHEFGSDLLAGISIVTAIVLGEYLAGTIVVLMLSGGEAIEAYAVRSASSVLEALASRIPSIAHVKRSDALVDVAMDKVLVGDLLVVYPHEICPVDGVVVEGHGSMDESYLTGEPYLLSKTPGSNVLSGAINGNAALTIRAEQVAKDSRYAKIMTVMQTSQQQRPRIRRLGDQLGAIYTPIAVTIALIAWMFSGEAVRFLAVLVVATPCPLLIAIPVAIIGSVSLAAKRAIIVRDPAALEQASTCRTMILDKTGTLTYGKPTLSTQIVETGFDEDHVLQLVASIEKYSKHPLAQAVLTAAQTRGLKLLEVDSISEKPGTGLTGNVAASSVSVTSRNKLRELAPEQFAKLPPLAVGLECVILINDIYAATYQFRDTPRTDGAPFINHLGPRHNIDRVMIVSGDRESEVRYLAELVGISEIYAEKSPEDKLQIVREETKRARTLYVGDGINDAPALLAATVGIAFGQNSDVTSEAAGAVIMDSSLSKVDEFLHIGKRMRRIALESALGGMGLSIIGMLFASLGWLPPVMGAVAQELIDVLAVLNALRVAMLPKSLTDFEL